MENFKVQVNPGCDVVISPDHAELVYDLNSEVDLDAVNAKLKESKIINLFKTGYGPVLEKIDEHLDRLEHELGLRNIKVHPGGLIEFFDLDYRPGEIFQDIIYKFLPTVDERLSDRFDGRYLCDDLIYECAFYRELPSQSPGYSCSLDLVRELDKHLEKYLNDDLIGIACPQRSPGSTVFKEILSECCRLHYRYLNDGDSGTIPVSPTFTSMVNTTDLINSLSKDEFDTLRSAMFEVVKDSDLKFIIQNIERMMDFHFCFMEINDYTAAAGASIVWSALIYQARKELLERELITEDTPITEIPYDEVNFLSRENTWNCRYEIINSVFK